MPFGLLRALIVFQSPLTVDLRRHGRHHLRRAPWSQYWPSNTDDGFGEFINPVRKHVVASTLSGDLGWNSRLVDDDPIDYVRGLAASNDEGIIVAGGTETVRSVFLAAVIDTLTGAVQNV